MKTRKIFRLTFYALMLPAAMAGMLLMFRGIGEGLLFNSLYFWVYAILGIWVIIHILFFSLEFTAKKEYWESLDNLYKKRVKLQDEIDGFIRSRQRYIKEWEKLNEIWEEKIKL